jgi:pimeloyl-ACP methyl ester carboxylesterase
VRWLASASTADRRLSPDRAVPANRDARRVTVEGTGHSGMLVAPDVITRIIAETRVVVPPELTIEARHELCS